MRRKSFTQPHPYEQLGETAQRFPKNTKNEYDYQSILGFNVPEHVKKLELATQKLFGKLLSRDCPATFEKRNIIHQKSQYDSAKHIEEFEKKTKMAIDKIGVWICENITQRECVIELEQHCFEKEARIAAKNQRIIRLIASISQRLAHKKLSQVKAGYHQQLKKQKTEFTCNRQDEVQRARFQKQQQIYDTHFEQVRKHHQAINEKLEKEEQQLYQ